VLKRKTVQVSEMSRRLRLKPPERLVIGGLPNGSPPKVRAAN
jgi:hypothetical protein